MNIKEVNLEALDLKYEKLRARQPAIEKKLFVSLGENGQQSPVIVVAGREPGEYVVIDGHKRVRSLKKLRADVAKVTIWDTLEEEALAENYAMSRQGGRNAVEEGWLVAELHRAWEWSLGKIGERLTKSKSWVSRRLSLVEEMPGWMADAISRGQLGAHAAVTYLVPLTRGNQSDGKLLTEKICHLGLSNRQVSEICQCYRAANAQLRRRLVEDPALFLRAQIAARQGKQDTDLSEGEMRCAKNLELIGNVSLGLMRSLPQALGSDGSQTARKKLTGLWNQCLERFEMLAKTAGALIREGKEFIGHVG